MELLLLMDGFYNFLSESFSCCAHINTGLGRSSYNITRLFRLAISMSFFSTQDTSIIPSYTPREARQPILCEKTIKTTNPKLCLMLRVIVHDHRNFDRRVPFVINIFSYSLSIHDTSSTPLLVCSIDNAMSFGL